jgi:hypothetical protein
MRAAATPDGVAGMAVADGQNRRASGRRGHGGNGTPPLFQTSSPDVARYQPMGRPTQKTLKRLFACAGLECAFPGCTSPNFDADGNTLADVAHIHADAPDGARYDPNQTEADRQSFDNLVVLCASHHRMVDAAPDTYPASFLRAIKSTQEVERSPGEHVAIVSAGRPRSGAAVVGNIGPMIIESPNAAIAQNMTIRANGRSVKVQPPVGTIGADERASRYVAYLIKRYNEFAASEPSRRTKFSYAAISKNVESKFNGKWQLQPLSKFNDICDYLHDRISKTRQAKLNTSKDRKSYRTFEAFD